MEDFEIFLFKHAEFMCVLHHLQDYKNILRRLSQTLPQSLRTLPETAGPPESPHQLPCPCAPAIQAHFWQDRTLPPLLVPSSPFTAMTMAMLFLFFCPFPFHVRSAPNLSLLRTAVGILKLQRLSHLPPV